MEETLIQSWGSQEELEELARLRRNKEITRGVISSVAIKQMPVNENGKFVSKEIEVAIFLLEGGIKAYCPATEFSSHQFKSITGFVGTFQNLSSKN